MLIIRVEATIIAIIVVKGGRLKKIVYLVKGHPTHYQLQYEETWNTDLRVAKINCYGTQSAL
jgi:hypothetical protein